MKKLINEVLDERVMAHNKRVDKDFFAYVFIILGVSVTAFIVFVMTA